ncbi:cell division protein [Escherichia coli]|uniref:cell division protein n=1 Tax=Escherichia coli TaxID=562 RepID=UPI002FCD5FE1
MTTDDIESYFGSMRKLLLFFGITTEAVYQWRNRPGQLIQKDVQQEAAYRTCGRLPFKPELYEKSNGNRLQKPQNDEANRG